MVVTTTDATSAGAQAPVPRPADPTVATTAHGVVAATTVTSDAHHAATRAQRTAVPAVGSAAEAATTVRGAHSGTDVPEARGVTTGTIVAVGHGERTGTPVAPVNGGGNSAVTSGRPPRVTVATEVVVGSVTVAATTAREAHGATLRTAGARRVAVVSGGTAPRAAIARTAGLTFELVRTVGVTGATGGIVTSEASDARTGSAGTGPSGPEAIPDVVAGTATLTVRDAQGTGGTPASNELVAVRRRAIGNVPRSSGCRSRTR